MSKVSIIIPVYGQWGLVNRNVTSLLDFDQDYIEEILVVDDCSPEPNPYTFNLKFVRVITNEKNLGYTGTVNIGLTSAVSDIVVLLDSDAYPLRPFIKKLIEMYAHDPTIGCIGFGTVDERGNDTGNFQYEPSIIGLIVGQLLEAKFEYLRFWKNKNILPFSCAVSYRKSCLRELDFFDGALFPVLEADNDISMRIHRSNWKLLFTKEILICHQGGNSYKVNYKRVMLFHESRWRLLRKHSLIMFPTIAKALLKGRISMEIAILAFLVWIKSGSKEHEDKLKGRKYILKELSSYS